MWGEMRRDVEGGVAKCVGVWGSNTLPNFPTPFLTSALTSPTSIPTAHTSPHLPSPSLTPQHTFPHLPPDTSFHKSLLETILDMRRVK